MPCSSICYCCVLIWDCSVAAAIHLVSGIIFQIHMNEFSCSHRSMIRPQPPPALSVFPAPSARDCCGEAMSCSLVLARLLPRCCVCILICNLRGIKRAQHRSRRGDGAARRSWRLASLGTLTAQPCAGGGDGKIQPGRERQLWRRNKDLKGLC